MRGSEVAVVDVGVGVCFVMATGGRTVVVVVEVIPLEATRGTSAWLVHDKNAKRSRESETNPTFLKANTDSQRLIC